MTAVFAGTDISCLRKTVGTATVVTSTNNFDSAWVSEAIGHTINTYSFTQIFPALTQGCVSVTIGVLGLSTARGAGNTVFALCNGDDSITESQPSLGFLFIAYCEHGIWTAERSQMACGKTGLTVSDYAFDA